jgi:hypothetical protein
LDTKQLRTPFWQTKEWSPSRIYSFHFRSKTAFLRSLNAGNCWSGKERELLKKLRFFAAQFTIKCRYSYTHTDSHVHGKEKKWQFSRPFISQNQMLHGSKSNYFQYCFILFCFKIFFSAVHISHNRTQLHVQKSTCPVHRATG